MRLDINYRCFWYTTWQITVPHNDPQYLWQVVWECVTMVPARFRLRQPPTRVENTRGDSSYKVQIAKFMNKMASMAKNHWPRCYVPKHYRAALWFWPNTDGVPDLLTDIVIFFQQLPWGPLQKLIEKCPRFAHFKRGSACRADLHGWD